MKFPQEYNGYFDGTISIKTCVEKIDPTNDPVGYVAQVSEQTTILATGETATSTKSVFFPQAIIDYIKNTVLA